MLKCKISWLKRFSTETFVSEAHFFIHILITWLVCQAVYTCLILCTCNHWFSMFSFRMTRNSTKLGRKKIPLDATPWSELTSDTTSAKKTDDTKVVKKGKGKVKKSSSKKVLPNAKGLKTSTKKIETLKEIKKELAKEDGTTQSTSGKKKKTLKLKPNGEAGSKSAKVTKKVEVIKQMKSIRKSESRRLKRIDLRNTDKVSLLMAVISIR